MTDLPTPVPADTVRHTTLATDLGELTLVVDDIGVRGLYFPGHWTRPDPAGFGPAVAAGDEPLAAAVTDQLGAYLEGTRRGFDLPLHLVGPAAARAIWAELATIPYGATTTYGALAARVGGTHARAVGRFVGANPVSVVVPCHRVVGSDGSLTGYAGGLERKRSLLELEGAAVAPPGLF